MTIAAGFHCMDGIVLCADSQESIGQYIKRNQPKLEIRPYIMPDNPQPCAVFAGSGDGTFIDFLIEKLWGAMSAPANKTAEDMILAAESELDAHYQRLVPLYPNGMPQADFLIGIWSSENDLELVKIIGPLLKRRVSHETIGYGSLLGTYLANRMLHPKSLVDDAMIVATYMIDQVKEHVAECGGETHAVTLSMSGNVRSYNQIEMKQRSARLAESDLIARLLVAVAADETLPQEVFEDSISAILERVRQLRKQQQK